MLTILYNLFQFTLLAILWPVFLCIVLINSKYRNRIPARLGFGLSQKLHPPQQNRTVFWVHALSVGEVTSAVPLIAALRNSFPDCKIVFSAATATGEAVAHKLLHSTADQIISSPLDILPVVEFFIRRIQPDVFILVETDFWPNTLLSLKRKNIPSILVNGRISQKSLADYRKFSFFFRPLFDSFHFITMQTRADLCNMQEFGIPKQKLFNLGNLKIDTSPESSTTQSKEIRELLPKARIILTAGSTHQGEELPILQVYAELRKKFPELYLVIAPRNPKRAEEIMQLGAQLRLQGICRSKTTHATSAEADYLLVDTIGELIEFYRWSTIAFVGGSLVPEGGHNPIEPANMSVPVLFGHHMEDFSEIAEDLLTAKGALVVHNQEELKNSLIILLSDRIAGEKMGLSAKMCIDAKRGVIEEHIRLIHSAL